MIGFNLLKKSFSNNLDKVGRSEIGLYAGTSFGGLPGSGNTTTFGICVVYKKNICEFKNCSCFEDFL